MTVFAGELNLHVVIPIQVNITGCERGCSSSDISSEQHVGQGCRNVTIAASTATGDGWYLGVSTAYIRQSNTRDYTGVYRECTRGLHSNAFIDRHVGSRYRAIIGSISASTIDNREATTEEHRGGHNLDGVLFPIPVRSSGIDNLNLDPLQILRASSFVQVREGNVVESSAVKVRVSEVLATLNPNLGNVPLDEVTLESD
mmetsp:Transcript_6460/g.12820  ORF Transcript_6460/g.12820 Transcript_6460/m.12820 type:complete len:200 (+) Transcript_6460:3048-3647(+)